MGEYGLAPSEFWGMTLSEFVYLYEWKRPKDKGDYPGSLNQGKVDELREWIEGWNDGATAP